MNNMLTRGQVYTLEQLESFSLSDAPFLMVEHEDHYYPVQTSHLTAEQLMNDLGWANTEWKYRYTTDEWIPIFYATIHFNMELVDIVPTPDSFGDDWSITPACSEEFKHLRREP